MLRDRGREVATFVDPAAGPLHNAAHLADVVLEAFHAWHAGVDGWYSLEVAGNVVRTVEGLPPKGEVYEKLVDLTHVHRAPGDP